MQLSFMDVSVISTWIFVNVQLYEQVQVFHNPENVQIKAGFSSLTVNIPFLKSEPAPLSKCV